MINMSQLIFFTFLSILLRIYWALDQNEYYVFVLQEGTKFEIVHEMSKCLGQPLYVFNCTKATDYIQLQDIFRGLATTGGSSMSHRFRVNAHQSSAITDSP